ALPMFTAWWRGSCFPSLAIALSLGLAPLAAQDLDTVVHAGQTRRFTLLDQIADTRERRAFLEAYEASKAAQRLERAEIFLRRFPQSWLLSWAHDIAAKAAIELSLPDQALSHAARSLRLLPENPFLLVPLARFLLEQKRLQEAAAHARDALDYLARFGAPAGMTPVEYSRLKRRLEASAHYTAGRALFTLGLRSQPGAPSADAVAHLEAASELDPADQNAVYLLGLAYLALKQNALAADAFQRASAIPGPLQDASRDQLRALPPPFSPQTIPSSSAAAIRDYAGSQSCLPCHAGQHVAWRKTGMARMFRRYSPENVTGDFSAPLPEATSRVFTAQGRHFFSVRMPDHTWRAFPVTHTIGSKWQQAYGTSLPDGSIHVFPLQFSLLEKRWVNYWRIIDPPNSPRADPEAFPAFSEATEYLSNCAPCHTSQLLQRAGAIPQYREEGVNCEMCHGPSLHHVVAMKRGKSFRKHPLEPPVEFRRIRAADYNAICNQCHAQSAIHEPGRKGEMNYQSSGPEFFPRHLWRPFAEFSLGAFYKDGRFRQTTFIGEAIARSKCSREGEVTCGHCHNPHPADAETNPASLKFPRDSDQMCIQCHQPMSAGHSRHPASSVGARCVACHMPRIMKSVLFSARTHQLDDIPNAEYTRMFGQVESPNACTLCHKTRP
ncbi:MAG: hypothetical protein ACKV2U_16835, partial [Bryobacteraceae bacterium]